MTLDETSRLVRELMKFPEEMKPLITSVIQIAWQAGREYQVNEDMPFMDKARWQGSAKPCH